MESAHETKDKGWQSLLHQHNSLHLVETSAHQLVYERATLTAAGTWLETLGFIGIHYMYLFFVSLEDLSRGLSMLRASQVVFQRRFLGISGSAYVQI